MKNILYAVVFTVVSFNSGALFADDQLDDLNLVEAAPVQAEEQVVQEMIPAAFTPTTGTYELPENVDQEELSQEISWAHTLWNATYAFGQELSEQAGNYLNVALEYVQSTQAYANQLYNSWH